MVGGSTRLPGVTLLQELCYHQTQLEREEGGKSSRRKEGKRGKRGGEARRDFSLPVLINSGAE